MRRVGVVGGGQLARMMAPPAINLGIELVVLLEDPSSGAGPVIPHQIAGGPADEQSLRRLAAVTDLITVDHEVLDLDLIDRLQAEGIRFRPDGATLRLAADKLEQKRRFVTAGIPTAEYREISTLTDFTTAVKDLGRVVVKTARGGYDGRGIWFDPTPEQISPVIGETPLFAEREVDHQTELAVVVARRPAGEVMVYDPVETIQADGMCRAVIAPARVSAEIAHQARVVALQVVAELNPVGVMAIEMFVADDTVLVNEVAPRPHNSGHHSIDSAVTSQFENHLRGVLDWPLGSAVLLRPAAMVNLVGSSAGTDPREMVDAGLAVDPAAKIHIYDKTPRPERKIGHVSVCDDDVEAALHRAWTVAEAMGCEVRA